MARGIFVKLRIQTAVWLRSNTATTPKPEPKPKPGSGGSGGGKGGSGGSGGPAAPPPPPAAPTFEEILAMRWGNFSKLVRYYGVLGVIIKRLMLMDKHMPK
ncbi:MULTISPECIES: hypothetical protein [Bacillus]|uniref:hypothetical protein n=1 Tax=Bacillus TaxID=1386 RepID=UPI0015E0F8D0|nr:MULTISPECIES: hypothetical protein [Bacillus]